MRIRKGPITGEDRREERGVGEVDQAANKSQALRVVRGRAAECGRPAAADAGCACRGCDLGGEACKAAKSLVVGNNPGV